MILWKFELQIVIIDNNIYIFKNTHSTHISFCLT